MKPISDMQLQDVATRYRHGLAELLETLRADVYFPVRELAARLSTSDNTLKVVWKGQHLNLDRYTLLLLTLLTEADVEDVEKFFKGLKELTMRMRDGIWGLWMRVSLYFCKKFYFW